MELRGNHTQIAMILYLNGKHEVRKEIRLRFNKMLLNLVRVVTGAFKNRINALETIDRLMYDFIVLK
jgi:hypothetical protein